MEQEGAALYIGVEHNGLARSMWRSGPKLDPGTEMQRAERKEAHAEGTKKKGRRERRKERKEEGLSGGPRKVEREGRERRAG